MSFKVIKAGFYSTVQDGGRFGFADRGLSKSGVLDEHAYRWANYLLDNHQTDAVLEITFGDCCLEALEDVVIAVTGAEMQFSINGKPRSNWHTYPVQSGDQLCWKTAQSGMRAYLAVQGGITTKTMFNARSVNAREHIGQALQVGDTLPFKTGHETLAARCVPSDYQADYSKPLHLHLLPSYQFEQFSPEQIKTFFKNTYQISQQSDRTGYRLIGKPLDDIPSKMTSEGMVVGSVEVTPQGLPIILMNDAPTIGGYPKIGTVVSEDLAKLAQRQPNTEVRFTLTNIYEAQQRKRQWLNFFSTGIAPMLKHSACQ